MREKHDADWLLGKGVAQRVLAVYRDIFGTLEPLWQETPLAPPPSVPVDRYLADRTVDELARLTGHAVRHLAARDSELRNRPFLRRCDWRVILYSLSGARTLREAIDRCTECFEAIDWRCGQMTLRLRADIAELELDSMRNGETTATACLIDLIGMTQINSLLSWLIGRAIPVGHVWLAHDPDAYRALDLPDMPFPLRLGRGWSGFDFDVALLDYPVVRTAEELAARPPRTLLFGGLVDGVLARPLPAQVRAIALRALADGQSLPDFGTVVTMLRMSEATLRRRLAREGTSYRQIRESCRRELALDLLCRTNLPIEDIATRLDYCDSDAFRQAFREWVGTSPTGYRQEMQLGGNA